MTAAQTSPPTSTETASMVLQAPAAAPADALEHFRSRLAFETDPSDLHADLGNGVPGIVVVDARSREAYARSHIPGAISLPHREMTAEATSALDRDVLYVSYCWGPGCNSSTKGAVKLAELGFRVKELIGGIEYWRREGYAVEGGSAAG